jgi:homoserine kinase type II
MSPPSLDPAAWSTLAAFGISSADVCLVALGNRGGFSGARLWRAEGAGGLYCLRAWPANGLRSDQLEPIHSLMSAARQRGLEFVPQIFATPSGSSWVERAGRLWDLTRWLPGQADFHDRPTAARLEAACSALARLHISWALTGERPTGCCRALQTRLDRAREWLALVATGWQPRSSGVASDPIEHLVRRAWTLVQPRIHTIPQRLAAWADRALPLQPCLCDIWHDHVLFEGDRLTGIVDYGSVKIDHVAVDLARLLGSMAADDAGLRAAGMSAYNRIRRLTEEEEGLVTALDETGTQLAAANWVLWVYRDGKAFEDTEEVARRIGTIVERIAKW